jgi:type III restriction enzyme
VPRVTVKVPTAGGKTFIACNALEKMFNTLQIDKPKVVAWFVPSDTILAQTLNNLRNPSHPYRQRIDAMFNGSVGVYDKEELLLGSNFDPIKVREQLTIAVLSIDSFASNDKKALRSYRENGYLQGFESSVQSNPTKLQNIDPTSLMQVLNLLNPVVIIDESHNFRSDLRVEVLKQINPSFILELTATPRENSNIISYVDAKQLKDEHMVKLPVIVYNSRTKTDVLLRSIQLRNNLEKQAIEEESKGGKYIRPIVLFQAQPRTSDDSETFDKIKQELIDSGIPEEQIKIKTADKNELKGVDLMDKECPVRYIITVNALKEGWDCPFAYILASLANRTSRVDVEQILGRILRLPYTKESGSEFLNMGYVFTSSADFQQTIANILEGLQSAGFSARDYRASELSSESIVKDLPSQPSLFDDSYYTDAVDRVNESAVPSITPNELPENKIDSDAIREALNSASNTPETPNTVSEILQKAKQENSDYTKMIDESGDESNSSSIPAAVFNDSGVCMKEIFKEAGEAIKLPVFKVRLENYNKHLFETSTQAPLVTLDKEFLNSGFDLNRCDKNITFEFADADAKRIDLEERNEDEFVPKAWTLKETELNIFKQYILSLPKDSRRKQLANKIADSLNYNCINRPDLIKYITDTIEPFDEDKLEQLTNNIGGAIEKFKAHISKQLGAYAMRRFEDLRDVGKIKMEPEYSLPKSIVLSQRDANGVPKSLYVEEEAVNSFESRVISAIADLDTVEFWHRNQERGKGFYINGFINHYPDFIVKMKNGMILLIEVKGDDRDNSDSESKIKLGKAWANKAGNDKYHYYMVFESNDNLAGAITLPKLIERLKQFE